MSSSTPFRIIICGGGIAGMSAAIALRAPGREITVLEQSRLASEIGATISLQPNASRILQQEWKLDPISEARGMVDRGFRIFNTDGEVVRNLPLTSKSEYGGDRIMYHRQDLHSYLQRAAISEDQESPAVTIRTSSRVRACDATIGTLTLEGGDKLSADLIVAADGIHSIVRQCVLGEVTPKPTGLSAYRLMIPIEVLEKEAPEFCGKISPRQPFTSMVMAHDCRLIMGPAREGSVYSIVALVPDDRMNEDADSKQSWVSRGDLGRMLSTFEAFPEWMTAVFKLTDDLGLWQLRDLDPFKTWTKGRVILIGDAAHAMLPTQGQGASQAVEDAEALGAYFDGFAAIDLES
ncbi:hypothetical protein WHR41_01449 [Cladosporium halotolerans]|uniref:FAD-binding domain-containing protein n=1 Tax=Cladosporium halotolerans TaxID=1052096 RepID=A0AB34KXL3_9PEZI